jgi:hypothetical protein
MVETSRKQSIAVESLVDLGGVEQTFVGPVTSFHVENSDPTRAQKLRDDLNARLRNGRAYLRAELPERYHYAADRRAGDVIVVMDEAWTLKRAATKLVQIGRRGAHGWDPAVPSMRALFVAMGPEIRAGSVIEPIDNVDVYPFMTELLGLRNPADIDGQPGRIREMVKK